jgi:hypothetical protein
MRYNFQLLKSSFIFFNWMLGVGEMVMDALKICNSLI